ncbi:hypothetical protein CBR_g40781 [Chara braunii]|uniref:Reticulon-like protein n=1 Tax=Chara braunii TaxID=69332 RepID=A0A388LUG9_CHABU|nr:hypothetical protein CBR_g40781 [Chara braunii]|eukprot:GBG85968.1 hypothetical protein CBR_g40781 [Chara braunii]
MDAGGVMAVDAYGMPLEIPPGKATTILPVDQTRPQSDESSADSPYENGSAIGRTHLDSPAAADSASSPVEDALLDPATLDSSSSGDSHFMSSIPIKCGADAENVVATHLPVPNSVAGCGDDGDFFLAAAASSAVTGLSTSVKDASSETSATSSAPVKRPRPPPKSKMMRVLFGKDTMHEILGGGNIADILLWRTWPVSSLIIFSFAFVWTFFHFSRYTLVSTCACITLFVLTNVAFVVDFVPPILPFVELKEDEVKRLASNFRIVANEYFAFLHYVAVGGNFKTFLKTLFYLCIASKIGRWFDFFTLSFVVLILAFTVPKAYEIYESDVDRAADLALEQSRKYYIAADKAVKSKLPIIRKTASTKQKVQ